MDKQKVKDASAAHFKSISGSISDVYAAKAAYLKDLATVDAMPKHYTAEHLQAQRVKAKTEYSARREAIREKVMSELDELDKTIAELHGELDLNSPALSNALRLIEMGGKDLRADTIAKINSSFAGDLPSLRVIQDVYKHVGVPVGNGIEQMIYDPAGAMKHIKEIANTAFSGPNAGVGALASNIEQLAKLEGLPFDFPEDPRLPLTDDEQAEIRIRYKIPGVAPELVSAPAVVPADAATDAQPAADLNMRFNLRQG